MDKSTHEIRLMQWKSIISKCQERPHGMSAKKWLTENNISDKSYYYYLHKFRKEAYITLKKDTSLPAMSTDNAPVTFTEIQMPVPDTCPSSLDLGHPVAVIKTVGSSIAISKDIPAEILSLILREVSHA